MTERFIFSQLNYNGDDIIPRKRKRSQVKRIPADIELSPRDSPIVGRPVTMTLIVPQETVAKPWFDPSKYVLTPRGYINRTIFSNNVPLNLERAHYLSSFSPAFIRDARLIIAESEGVLGFVLACIRQVPCNVPLRWGVLFNLKFRRVFQCLTLEKWGGLLACFKKHFYAVVLRGSVHFVDPTRDAPEQIVFPESQVSQEAVFDLSSDNNDDYNHDYDYEDGNMLVKTRFPISPRELAVPRIDPFRTPERGNNTNIHSFLFNSPPSITHIPSIPVASSTPVPRNRNDSIYAINLSNSISPALADRFETCRFSGDVILAIRRLYGFSDSALESVYNTLRTLPVSIPLRWGCIYNKYLRVRSKAAASQDAGTSLLQWKQLRELFINYGYLDDRSVANCSILINK